VAGRYQGGPPDGASFIWQTLLLRMSEAWRRRSDDLKILLELLENENMRHAGRENGALLVLYDDLVKAGIRRANIAATIKEGETLRLIEAQRQGKQLNTGRREPTRYRLTYLATYSDGKWHLPSDDWKLYRPASNSETRFRRRNSVGSASGTRARQHFSKAAEIQVPPVEPTPSSAGGTAIYISGESAPRSPRHEADAEQAIKAKPPTKPAVGRKEAELRAMREREAAAADPRQTDIEDYTGGPVALGDLAKRLRRRSSMRSPPARGSA
jgi:hypothetical protein